MYKLISHIGTFLVACVISYFVFPINLSSPLTLLTLLIINLIVVESIDFMFKKDEKEA